MITQKDIDRLNFLHDRLVAKYGESENTDYLIAARETITHIGQFKNLPICGVSVSVLCDAPEHIKPCRHEFSGICQYNSHCNFKKTER